MKIFDRFKNLEPDKTSYDIFTVVGNMSEPETTVINIVDMKTDDILMSAKRQDLIISPFNKIIVHDPVDFNVIEEEDDNGEVREYMEWTLRVDSQDWQEVKEQWGL